MSMPAVTITTIELAVPPLIGTQEIAAKFADEEGGRFLVERARSSGVVTKGNAVNPLEEDPRGWGASQRMRRAQAAARDLTRRAAQAALDEEGLLASDVGLFATCTTTAHHVPGLDAVAADLEMPADTPMLSLGPMGCYAALPSLAACRDWVTVHQRPALLVCADVFSPHLQPAPYDKEKAAVFTLFGDAAAAVVLRPETDRRPGPTIVDSEMVTACAYADGLRVRSTDTGIVVRLPANVPDVVAAHVAKPVDTLLARHGLRREDMAWWAVHPGGRRIIEQVTDELHLPDASAEAARAELRENGNTISAAVLLVLRRLQQAHPLAPGQHGMALAFGPGATIWAVLFTGSKEA